MARRMPLSMAAFVVASLSMIGVPPTTGFFSKWYLLLGCLDESRYPFAAALLLSTWLNAWYFFRLIERAYFTRGEHHRPARSEAPLAMAVPIAALAGLVLISGAGSYTLVRDVVRPAIDALPVAVCRPGAPCSPAITSHGGDAELAEGRGGRGSPRAPRLGGEEDDPASRGGRL
jgi:formate hydrogenlyase subunit 3/multisubunit Na+/H+ antiporter MnhD subunit